MKITVSLFYQYRIPILSVYKQHKYNICTQANFLDCDLALALVILLRIRPYSALSKDFNSINTWTVINDNNESLTFGVFRACSMWKSKHNF